MGWFYRGSDRERERSKTAAPWLCVGRKYPAFANGESGYTLEYVDGQFVLYVLKSGWDFETLKQFAPDADMRVHWTDICGMGFLCVKFGNMPWGDCPFHPGMLKTDRENLVFSEAGEYKGIILNVVCADSKTGEVMQIRRAELARQFSAGWVKWLNKALEDEEADYAGKIAAVYESYSSQQLAAEAALRFSVSELKRRTDDD